MESKMPFTIFNPGYTECENKNDLVNRKVGEKMNRFSLNYNPVLAKSIIEMFSI